MKCKSAFDVKVREVCAHYFKETPNYEDIKVKKLYKELTELSEATVADFDLFKMMEAFHKSIVKRVDFKVNDGQHWESAIGYRFLVPSLQDSQ